MMDILEHEPSITEAEIVKKVPELLCSEFEYKKALAVLPVQEHGKPDLVAYNVSIPEVIPNEMSLDPELAASIVNLSKSVIPWKFMEKFPDL